MSQTMRGWMVALIFIIFMGGLSLWFLYDAWNYWQLDTDLENRGISTQALVIECHSGYNSHDIIYEFEVEKSGQTDDPPPTKQTYRIKESSSSSRCYELEGTIIAIKYLPEDPTRASREGYARGQAKISCCLSLIPIIIFILTFYNIKGVIKKIKFIQWTGLFNSKRYVIIRKEKRKLEYTKRIIIGTIAGAIAGSIILTTMIAISSGIRGNFSKIPALTIWSAFLGSMYGVYKKFLNFFATILLFLAILVLSDPDSTIWRAIINVVYLLISAVIFMMILTAIYDSAMKFLEKYLDE